MWVHLIEVLYALFLTATCCRIIYDTQSTAKTLAYLLLAIFVPVAGILFYFSFGINYRKRQLYNKKIIDDEDLWTSVNERVYTHSVQTYERLGDAERPDKRLVKFLFRELSPLSEGNAVSLLTNGEEKFPAVLKALHEAKDHIHIEYYIYENDTIGRAIEEILIQKSRQGVEVRFMYDDFGSRTIRRNIARRLRDAGVEVYPFYKITFIALANRLNYRNHRKIIVIDGNKGFVGGINVSDRYVNGNAHQLYWRDTHLLIEGPAVSFLQYLFIGDWNFCSGQKLQDVTKYFPDFFTGVHRGDKVVQFAASGPDSKVPSILYSLLLAIHQAKNEILITTPYLIPEQSIMDALIASALGGVSVKVLIPGRSDSMLVGFAARSYYGDLLAAGVKLFAYQKGFVHAKTLVVDSGLVVVGTANMDYRSFDLNFEVNALVFNAALAGQMREVFENDLRHSVVIDAAAWERRALPRRFAEKVARLVSPLL